MFTVHVIGTKCRFLNYNHYCSRLGFHSTACVKKIVTRKPEIFNIPSTRKESRWRESMQKIFGKYLLLTNTISSGILMGAGDLIQQQIEYVVDGKHEDCYDWIRNRNMTIIGLAQGPIIHYFYQALDKLLPGIKVTTILKKIFLDQTLASPFCIILFFLGMGYLNNDNFEESKKELKDKFLTVYAADCCIWIPSQFINFYCLSAEYRVMYINLVTMCYNVFLSFIKHNEV